MLVKAFVCTDVALRSFVRCMRRGRTPRVIEVRCRQNDCYPDHLAHYVCFFCFAPEAICDSLLSTLSRTLF